MTPSPAAALLAVAILGGCTRGGPPATSPRPSTPSPFAPASVASRGRLPSVVLTADLSEPPASWDLVASIPYGADEPDLGLRFFPGEGPDSPGLHRSPASFAVAGDRTFWILDTVKARLAHYSDRGEYLGQVTGLGYGRGKPVGRDLSISGGRIYVLEDGSPDRTLRVGDFSTFSAPVTARYQSHPLLIGWLYPSTEGVIGWVSGYLHPLGGGPRGFAQLDIPGSGSAHLLPGIPVGPSRWIDLDAPDDQDIEITYRSPGSSAVQPLHVDIVRGLGSAGDRLDGLVGPGIEVAFTDAVGVRVSILAYERQRQVGQTWYLRLGADAQPLIWERLPDEDEIGELKSKHLAAGPGRSVYLMRSTEDGEEIYRRP